MTYRELIEHCSNVYGCEMVTYCEDCTYYDAENFDGFCWFHNSMVKESDYCSFAKRKDEEK